MNIYQYQPLSAICSEIRLLRLLPNSSADEISIEIFHASISSKPAYEALSYVWGCIDRIGTVNVTNSIQDINGGTRQSTLDVGANLYVALQNLRSSDTPRVLWVDAICINQDDSAERSSEVLAMGSIYHNANQVIVWLGPSSHNSNLALQTLELIGSSVTYSPERKTIGRKPGSWPASLERDAEALISHADSWIAIKDLLLREWFSRLWVFQEIVLARKASLVVGKICLDWKISVLGLRWIWMMSSRHLNRVTKPLKIEDIFVNNIWPFLEQGCNHSAQSITEILDHTQYLLCSDPRDRLYAIRSLLRHGDSKIIVPDYSLSVRQVYSNFVKEWLSELSNVNFLAYCDLSHAEKDIGLPSWAPNWSHTMSTLFLSHCRSSSTSIAYSTPIDSSRCLSLQGVMAGSLSFIAPSEVGKLSTETEILELCRSWLRMVSVNESTYSEEKSKIKDYFAETIVAGRLAEKLPSIETNNSSLDDIKSFLKNSSSIHDRFMGVNLRVDIRDTIHGRLLFKIANGKGFFGLGSQTARLNDRIAVILGCNYPIILRPEKIDGKGCFRVVGPCYIPGIADGEALLGPLPSGWRVREERICGARAPIFTNGNIFTQQDPRMALPPTWRYRYKNEKAGFQETEAEALENMTPQWFENVETGETTQYDPRLTPQNLKGEGVAIEEIILI